MGLFGGGSKSSQQSHQESGNKNLGLINGLYSDVAGGTKTASDAIGNMLYGTDTSAFDNFRNNTGYDFQMDQGVRALQNSAFAGGSGNSGATMKAITKFGQNLANTSYQSYMDNLFKQANLGLGAGGLLANAGQYSVGDSSSSSKSKNGLGAEIGGLGSAIGGVGSVLGFLSDRRAKEDIKFVEELAPGLNLYEYKYIGNDPTTYYGVMADEVEKTYPEALGPMQGDFQTVNYYKLRELLHA